MFTIYIRINKGEELVQVKNLLDIDQIIISHFIALLKYDIEPFKNFVKDVIPNQKEIKLKDYNKYLNSTGRENSTIEIFHTENDQPPMYVDIDYWINYVYQNSKYIYK